MLVSPGGRERTVDEFVALFTAAELDLKAVAGGSPVAVIEAVPRG